MQDIKQLIQKDLDNGKFVQICSNETSFKDYVFEKLNLAVEQEKERVLAMVLKEIEQMKKETMVFNRKLTQGGGHPDFEAITHNQALDTLKEKLQAKQ